MNFLSKVRRPRIAIIIPVHNVTGFLEETLQSVATQDYRNKEIIIVNDGSSPTAVAEMDRICSGFKDITRLHQKHLGAAAARDRGTAYTSAELILFLDGDDILLPGALTYFAKALNKSPDAIAAYARVRYIDKNCNRIADRPFRSTSGTQLLYDLLARVPSFCNGSICVRKQALQKLCADNHSETHGEDWILWCHLALYGTIIPAGDKFVLEYREHDSNVSTKLPEKYPGIIATFDKVYQHPAFIAAVGKEKLRNLREMGLSRLHFTLARYYAWRGNMEEASYHLNKISIEPHLFQEYGIIPQMNCTVSSKK